MPNKTFTSQPIMGVNFDEKRTTVDGPAVRVGTFVQLLSDIPGVQGRWAMYVQASGVIGNSNYVTVDLGSITCLASSVEAGASGTTGYFRNGSVAFAASEYGWVYTNKNSIPNPL